MSERRIPLGWRKPLVLQILVAVVMHGLLAAACYGATMVVYPKALSMIAPDFAQLLPQQIGERFPALYAHADMAPEMLQAVFLRREILWRWCLLTVQGAMVLLGFVLYVRWWLRGAKAQSSYHKRVSDTKRSRRRSLSLLASLTLLCVVLLGLAMATIPDKHWLDYGLSFGPLLFNVAVHGLLYYGNAPGWL